MPWLIELYNIYGRVKRKTLENVAMLKIFFTIRYVRVFLSGLILCAASAAFQAGYAAESDGASNQSGKSYAIRNQFLNTVSESYQHAQKWLINNIRDEGIFVYLYDPVNDTYAAENSLTRQLMASRLLAGLAFENTALRQVHKKNLEFIFSHWYKENENGLGYMLFHNQSELAANAMALRTLVHSPFFAGYSNQAQKIAEGIVSLMNKDGSLKPWFRAADPEINEDLYSGAAILSLGEYAAKSNQGKYLLAAITAQEFYLNKYITYLDQNNFAAGMPRHTISLANLFKMTSRDEYADAVFRLNDALIKYQDTTRVIGRFHQPEYLKSGQPDSSTDGVYTESLAYAYELAKQKNDFMHQAVYKNAIQLSVKHLTGLQYTKEYSKDSDRKDQVEGAFRISTENQRIRIDCTQQVMDAYRKIMEVY
jgi:hypothetical protein